MSTVTLQLASLDDVKRRARQAFSRARLGTHISFVSPEVLFRLITAKRWELIRSMAGAEPMTIRAAARIVGRDVKAVHRDVHALLDAGILQKADKGRIVFPFDAIHVDLVLRAA